MPPDVLAMNYQATKIRLTCDEGTVRAWSAYMLDHIDEVSLALRNESVRHEMWFMGRDPSLFVIGIMDVDDAAASQAIAARSWLGVDEVHKAAHGRDRAGQREPAPDGDRSLREAPPRDVYCHARLPSIACGRRQPYPGITGACDPRVTDL
jgi:hypothetical protein